MRSADIKKVLFQEEVEMKPTSLIRSAEEVTVRYENNCLQKEAQAQQVFFCFVFQVGEAEQETLLEAQLRNFEGGQKNSKHSFLAFINILDGFQISLPGPGKVKQEHPELPYLHITKMLGKKHN